MDIYTGNEKIHNYVNKDFKMLWKDYKASYFTAKVLVSFSQVPGAKQCQRQNNGQDGPII